MQPEIRYSSPKLARPKAEMPTILAAGLFEVQNAEEAKVFPEINSSRYTNEIGDLLSDSGFLNPGHILGLDETSGYLFIQQIKNDLCVTQFHAMKPEDFTTTEAAQILESFEFVYNRYFGYPEYEKNYANLVKSNKLTLSHQKAYKLLNKGMEMAKKYLEKEKFEEMYFDFLNARPEK
jgi:hypothetical protein